MMVGKCYFEIGMLDCIFVWTEILVRSPRTLGVYIVYKYVYRIKVSKRVSKLALGKASLMLTFFASSTCSVVRVAFSTAT